MAATKGRDNPLEKRLRTELHRRGLRFRVHRRLLPGTTRSVDIAFIAQRVAILIDGCFWHGCPKHGTWPKNNAAWWRAKIEANRARDCDTDARLRAQGWCVVRIWEHESVAVAAGRVQRILGRRNQMR
jgi:DNA mismatch endonuclease (patch repair protein)